jgi:hypothetical protein
VLLPVWGATYIDMFVNYALPSQLADHGLGVMRLGQPNLYRIYTRRVDVVQIKAAESFTQLAQVAVVSFVIIEDLAVWPRVKDDKNALMNACHQDGMQFAASYNTAMLMFAPDIIFARHALAYVHQLLLSGKRAVIALCMTANYHTIAAKLQPHHRNEELAIDARSLVDLCLQHLHPFTMKKFVNVADNRYILPASMYWQVGDEGVLAHSFHLAPIMVYPDKNEPFFDSIDGDYLAAACKDLDSIAVVRDSDQIFLCELSEPSNAIDIPYRNGKISDIVNWALIHANQQHRQMFVEPVIVKGSKYNPDSILWWQAANDAQQLVAAVNAKLASYNPILHFLCEPLWFIRKLLRDLKIMVLTEQRRKTVAGYGGGARSVKLACAIGITRWYRLYVRFINKFLIWQSIVLRELVGNGDTVGDTALYKLALKLTKWQLETTNFKIVKIVTFPVTYVVSKLILLGCKCNLAFVKIFRM